MTQSKGGEQRAERGLRKHERQHPGSAIRPRSHQHLPLGLSLGTYVKFTSSVINATKHTEGAAAVEPALSLEKVGDPSARPSSALTPRYDFTCKTGASMTPRGSSLSLPGVWGRATNI